MIEDGWHRVDRLHGKGHYFLGGESLCKKWNDENADVSYAVKYYGDDGHGQCRECMRRLRRMANEISKQRPGVVRLVGYNSIMGNGSGYLVGYEQDVVISPDLEKNEFFQCLPDDEKELLRVCNRGHPLTYDRMSIDDLEWARVYAKTLSNRYHCKIEEYLGPKYDLAGKVPEMSTVDDTRDVKPLKTGESGNGLSHR